ncbi:DUF1616 domain-containing protein [Candidatus Bathyarchaeota archaeon]|nr:DUF1616 domain-containing protein [Candidatus Bathyarchaeota archaeon]
MRITREKKPETVKVLITLAKQELPCSEREILKLVIELQSNGQIKFTERSVATPSTLSTYLKTSPPIWYCATIALAVITTICVFTVPDNLYPWIYSRYVLGAIFVLWLPGYTFIQALFLKETPFAADDKNLYTIIRIALSAGLSLALVPIVGLLLNYTPWGIRLTPITLSLLALTLILATVALVREHNLQISQAACPSPNSERLPETQQSTEVSTK